MTEAPQQAVQQLLIAETLLADYGALERRLGELPRRETVGTPSALETLAHAPAVLGGETVDPDELVGRANQLYPSIWQNLVGARDVLAAVGRDVGRFDALRRKLGSGEDASGGLIEREAPKIDIVESLADRRLHGTQVSRYSLNARGAALAAEGLAALKAACPEVDWGRLAGEQRDEVAALSRGLGWTPAKRILVALPVALVVALVLLCWRAC